MSFNLDDVLVWAEKFAKAVNIAVPAIRNLRSIFFVK